MENLLIPYKPVRQLAQGTALVLAPHPDDEIFGCGGAILRHVEAGDPVQVIIVSDGGFSTSGAAHDHAAYVRQRQQESREAARVLGYGTPVFWGLADRSLVYGEKLVRQILAAVESADAAIVYAPSIFEVHPDHRALGMAAIEAVRRSDKPRQLALYEVSMPLRPNALLDITDLVERKQTAMACFVSQLEIQDYDQHIAALNRYRAYTLPKHVKAAEAYLLLSTDALRQDPLGLYESEFRRQKKLGLSIDIRDMPLVTVIIRSMGRDTLTEAFDSVALQTYPNIEVVVVNAKGESHPDIGEWCGRFPLRLCGTGQPLPRSRAANVGLDHARGQYLIFLDDDDLFDAGHVEDLVGVMQKYADARAVYSGVRCVFREGKKDKETLHVLNVAFDRHRLMSGNFIPIHAVLFDRRVVDEGCRFDEQLDVCEDWDFWLQILQHGLFKRSKTVSATYRCSGVSGVGPGAALQDGAKVAAARARIFERWKAVWSGADLNAMLDEKEKRHAAQSNPA